MVNITALQEYLDTSNSKNITLVSLVGSGLGVFFDEVKQNRLMGDVVKVDMMEQGEICECNSLKLITHEIYKYLNDKDLVTDPIFPQLNDYFNCYLYLKSLVNGLKRDVTLVIDNADYLLGFDPYFYDTIASIFSNQKLNLIQIVYTDINDIKYDPSIFGKYYAALFNIVEYVSGYKPEEIANSLSKVSDDSETIAAKLYEMTAGHVGLINTMLDILALKVSGGRKITFADIESIDFLTEPRIIADLSAIVESLNEEILSGIYEKRNFEDIDLEFVKSVGILSADNKLNLTLIERANVIVEETDEEDETLETEIVQEQLVEPKEVKSHTPSVNYVDNTDTLSAQEFEVYEIIKSAAGQVVSKDDIAKKLWKTSEKSKKQDWAIDQLIKRLREKIGDKSGSQIQTIRGRGYKYTV